MSKASEVYLNAVCARYNIKVATTQQHINGLIQQAVDRGAKPEALKNFLERQRAAYLELDNSIWRRAIAEGKKVEPTANEARLLALRNAAGMTAHQLRSQAYNNVGLEAKAEADIRAVVEAAAQARRAADAAR